MRASAGALFPSLPKTSTSPFVTRPRDESLGQYSKSATSSMLARGLASRYASMLANPFTPSSERYPDEAIVPTGVVRLTASSSYAVTASGDFRTRMSAKLFPAAVDNGCIYPPVPAAGPLVYSDYGSPQAAWVGLSTVDRTLAAAIRVRVVGLPSGVFLPSGTLYFLQAQLSEAYSSFDTEPEAISAVTARKGFSLTLNELNSLGSVHIPLLPQGPMSYLFSPSGIASASAGGGTLAGSPLLWVTGFGLPAGATLRFDYVHHVEYIPSVPAAGLIATSVQLPSAPTRDAIATITQGVQSSIAGATSGTQIRSILGSGGSAPSILSNLSDMARVAMNPFAREGGSGAFARAGAGGGGDLAFNTSVPVWMKSAMGLLSAAGI